MPSSVGVQDRGRPAAPAEAFGLMSPKEDGFGVGAFMWRSAMALGSARSVSQTTHTGKSEYPEQERKALMLAE